MARMPITYLLCDICSVPCIYTIRCIECDIWAASFLGPEFTFDEYIESDFFGDLEYHFMGDDYDPSEE